MAVGLIFRQNNKIIHGTSFGRHGEWQRYKSVIESPLTYNRIKTASQTGSA
jgi:hypothetical protein